MTTITHLAKLFGILVIQVPLQDVKQLGGQLWFHCTLGVNCSFDDEFLSIFLGRLLQELMSHTLYVDRPVQEKVCHL